MNVLSTKTDESVVCYLSQLLVEPKQDILNSQTNNLYFVRLDEETRNSNSLAKFLNLNSQWGIPFGRGL